MFHTQRILFSTNSKYEWLYGTNVIVEALSASKRRLLKLYVKETLPDEQSSSVRNAIKLASELSIPIQKCSKSQLDKYASDRPHQNMVLQTTHLQVPRIQSLGPLNQSDEYDIIIRASESIHMYAEREYPLFIALDSIQDPQNLGAILRTCHFFKIDGIVITEHQTSPFNETVSKASSGALETDSMELFTVKNLAKFLEASAENGWHIYGTDIKSKNKRELTEKLLNAPTILVVGNEGSGIKHHIAQKCHEHLIIPNLSTGSIDSLNVSVATGILIHSILK